jgi:hypothetical protein
MIRKSRALFLIAILAILSVSACDTRKPGDAAPLNDTNALEKLAAAYQEISDQLPVSPVKLPPKARLKFVGDVFEKAGYGYRETLTSLAEVHREEITKLHRDMLELLFMPHYRMQHEALSEIYSENEIQAINKIKTVFK